MAGLISSLVVNKVYVCLQGYSEASNLFSHSHSDQISAFAFLYKPIAPKVNICHPATLTHFVANSW